MNFAAGPIRPAMNALSKVFGSVIPPMYIATTAEADARNHDAAAACNFFVSIVLLTRCPQPHIVFYSFGLRSLRVRIQTIKDAKVTFPMTTFALPVNTSHAEKRPTKVQISLKKSAEISLKNDFNLAIEFPSN